MSAEATGWTWKHSPLSGSGLLVHLAIADVVNDLHDHQFWMSTEALARKAKVGRSSTVTALRDLVEGGFLEVVEHGGGRGRYTTFRFLWPETARSLAGSETARRSPETARSGGETARSALHTKDELKNVRTQADLISKPQAADMDCLRCHGSGSLISPTPGPDNEPFAMPCPCTAVDYEPPPPAATRPPADFAMPADRFKQRADLG